MSTKNEFRYLLKKVLQERPRTPEIQKIFDGDMADMENLFQSKYPEFGKHGIHRDYAIFASLVIYLDKIMDRLAKRETNA